MPETPTKPPRRDVLLESLAGLASPGDDGLDPDAVWHRGVARRRRRGLAAGVAAVAVLAGGAWGAGRFAGPPEVVVAAPSPVASASATPAPGPSTGTAAMPVEASVLANTRWRVAGLVVDGATTDLPDTTWAFGDPAVPGSLVVTSGGRRETASWRADGSRVVVDGGTTAARIVAAGPWDVTRTSGGITLASARQRWHLVLDPGPGVATSFDGLAGTRWDVVEVADATGRHGVRGTGAHLVFSAGQVGGSDGANSFGCPWQEYQTASRVAGVIALGSMRPCVSTQVALAVPPSDPRWTTQAAVDALERAASPQMVALWWEGPRLVVHDGGRTTLVLERA